jgi:hypothetical protein
MVVHVRSCTIDITRYVDHCDLYDCCKFYGNFGVSSLKMA